MIIIKKTKLESGNPATQYWMCNGKEYAFRADTIAETQMFQNICADQGVDYGSWLANEPIRIGTQIIDEAFPGHAASDMLDMKDDPANANKTELLTAIAASKVWLRAMRDQGLALTAEIQAGTRTAVAVSDFLAVGAPPFNYGQIVAMSKQ